MLRGRARSIAVGWLMDVISVFSLLNGATTVWAQVGIDRDDYFGPRALLPGGALGVSERTFPRPGYYFPFAAYYDGRYDDALEGFQDAAGHSRKVPGPWMDAIAHHAMLGECYFQLGRLENALEEHTAALQVTLAYPKWLDRVHFAENLRQSSAMRYGATPWGQSRRNPTLAHFPSELAYQEGDVYNTKPVTQGGVVRPAQLISINPFEVVRGTCLALRRRHQIMGPIGYTDPLHQQIIELYAQPTRGDWPRFLTDVPLGFAYRAAGKGPQAQAVFERSITVDDFDHPLTGMVLLELGGLAYAAGDVARAADYFVEASYAAAAFDDADTIEAAFDELVAIERTLNQERDLPSLMLAANWAGSRDLRKLRVMLLAAAAERQASLGQTEEAAEILAQVEQLVGRRDMRSARPGAWLHFVESLVRYQQNEVTEGDRLVTAAVDWQKRGSVRPFQLGLLQRRVADGEFTARTATAQYAELLREPGGQEWTHDPLEALTSWSSSQASAYDHWFLMAWERKRPEDLALLLEIAERARRHRFLSALELGGRPQTLRWLVTSPPEQLRPELRLQGQDLLVRFPELRQSQLAADKLKAQFGALAAANETELRRTNLDLLERLSAHRAAEKRAFRELSVRREPAGIPFPPIRTLPALQRALPERQALLAFAEVHERMFGFLVMREQYQAWEVGPSAKLHEDVAALFKAWHHSPGRRSLSASELRDPEWIKRASSLLSGLTSGAASDFPVGLAIDDLTVIPEGVLWYLPFEALVTGLADEPKTLITHARVRYAPTAGLAVEPRQPSPIGRTTVVLGKMVARQPADEGATILSQLEKAAPGAVGWQKPLGEAAAVAATLSGRLVVLDELSLDGRNPFGWSPLGYNRGDSETSLADWLDFPWASPRQLLLPGFHTAAEVGLVGDQRDRKEEETNQRRFDGDELFLSVMALAGSGTRTVLLSRWRTGGGSTLDELREFVQELPYTSPADAWQRSALLCMQTPLEPAREPRLIWKSQAPPPAANHPFFWSASMLIDCGVDVDNLPEVDPLAELPGK